MIEANGTEVVRNPSVATEIIQSFANIGIIDFVLPFLLTTVVLFALLRKSKIFSRTPIVNIILPIAIGLLIMGVPNILGLSFTTQFSSFFFQLTILILFFTIGGIIVSFFVSKLDNIFKNKQIFIGLGIIISIILFFTSGLYTIFTEQYSEIDNNIPGPDPTLVLFSTIAIIMSVIMIIFSFYISTRK